MANHKTFTKDRYEALFENSADAILIIEGEKFVDCNRAAVEMLRAQSREEVLQTHPSELSPEQQPDGRKSFEKANEMMAIALEKGTHRFEWEHKRMDGEIFPVEVLLTAIPHEKGYDLHTVWRDISERKQLENELRHAQKMEVIGKFCGGIAHDFNNQLVPILGYADLLEENLVDPDSLSLVNSIKEAGTRAAALVNRLMIFSHKEERQTKIIDLQDIIRELLLMVSKLVGEDIHFNVEHCADDLLVNMDPGDVEQIILNLTTNARDAMPSGGNIHLRLSRARRNGYHYACICFADEGTGMEEKILARIFEPFFTTKQIGSGTGLGLSTVYSAITHAAGVIEVDSEPGAGTTFTIYLPQVTQEEDRPLPNNRDKGPDIRTRKARILVVEDDDAVAMLITSVLGNAGHEVTHAKNGVEGLARAGAQPFDLILTDVIMPVKGGAQMVRELRESHIATPVIFISGYTDDRLQANDFDTDTVNILKKPFRAVELLNKVNAVMAGNVTAPEDDRV